MILCLGLSERVEEVQRFFYYSDNKVERTIQNESYQRLYHFKRSELKFSTLPIHHPLAKTAP